jgi:hypothetical protein
MSLLLHPISDYWILIIGQAMPQSHSDELNRYVEAWKALRDSGSAIGLWENPELVSSFMAAMGRKGGLVSNPKKGFGSMSPERRKEIAARANTARWSTAEPRK